MKHPLTPEASGTLAALHRLNRITAFTPDCAEELVTHDYAKVEHGKLAITAKGRKAAKHIHAAVAGLPVRAEA